MKVQLEAELPFEECKVCLAFDPVIDKGAVKYDENKHELDVNRKLTCKGYTFCKYIGTQVLQGGK